MTDCSEWLNDLTYTAERVLNEDLAALQRMPERSRIERYNDIKQHEEELLWEYSKECPDFLTAGEEDRLRGELRLARLLLAASFYADSEVPNAMEGDFIEAELQAVVEFDHYKQFDALDEEQIEERIKRMEGEVYELVQDYTSTQIANMDELVDNPDVQQDVIERLVDRYDERRGRIRQGFFVYVETHGIEHMVEAIEEAVEAVAEATEERERVREAVRSELQELESSLESGFERQRKEFETGLHRVEQQVASETVDAETIQTELDDLDGIDATAISELNSAIDRTHQLEADLDEKIDELERTRERASEAGSDRAREEATEVVQAELERLSEQRDQLRTEIDRLQHEREEIEHARDRLSERQQTLEERLEQVETSVDAEDDTGLDGTDVVTSTTARLFQMDYLGRFDTTMHELSELSLPDDVVEISDGYWDDRSERRTEAPRMVDLLEEHDGGNIETYPTNSSTRYEVTESAYLGISDRLQLIVEARVFSHLEAHAVNGFDAAPADLDDLLGIVNDVVHEVDQKEVPYLLGIASPTGWTDRVEKQVQDDELARTRYSRQLSVCLVDLRDGELIYDRSDSLIQDNIHLFERAVGAERVDDCVATVRSEYGGQIGRETVLLEEIVDEKEFDRHIVKRAFDRLEDSNEGEQFYVDEDGLALDVG